jgi:hypothetical protein
MLNVQSAVTPLMAVGVLAVLFITAPGIGRAENGYGMKHYRHMVVSVCALVVAVRRIQLF